jgi:hypothetical protein
MSRFIAGTAVEAEEREAPEAERLFAELDARLYGDGQDDADYDQIDVKATAWAICQDLGIDPGPDWWEEAWGINARDPSPGRGRKGPVRGSEREDGVTDLTVSSTPRPASATGPP